MVFTGNLSALVRTNDYPTYEEWWVQDRTAIGAYDMLCRHSARPKNRGENALGQRVLGTQVGRGHLALVYSTERQGAVGPAQYARECFSRTSLRRLAATASSDDPWPGCRRLDVGPAVSKDLGIIYEILGRDGPPVHAARPMAYEKFLNRADPDDPDLPVALKYLQQARPVPILPNEQSIAVDPSVSVPPNLISNGTDNFLSAGHHAVLEPCVGHELADDQPPGAGE